MAISLAASTFSSRTWKETRTNERTDGKMNKATDGRTHERTIEQMEGLSKERTDGRTSAPTSRRTKELKSKTTDGGADGLMHKLEDKERKEKRRKRKKHHRQSERDHAKNLGCKRSSRHLEFLPVNRRHSSSADSAKRRPSRVWLSACSIQGPVQQFNITTTSALHRFEQFSCTLLVRISEIHMYSSRASF